MFWVMTVYIQLGGWQCSGLTVYSQMIGNVLGYDSVYLVRWLAMFWVDSVQLDGWQCSGL